MSESSTRLRIAAMWGEIAGIITPFPQIPRALQDAQLPGSVVFPGIATHSRTDFGEQLIHEIRTYKMVLYIEKATFGASGEGQINADPFFDAVLNHFAARPGLELDSQGVNQTESAFQSELLSDGGLQVGPYPLGGQGSADYIQIQWDLQVQEIIAVNYQD